MTDEERNGPEETFHDTERKLRARIEALELALTRSRAETAAAYERAAREVDCGGCGGSCDDPMNCAAENAAEIRALATPDQTAALDRLIAEAEARAWKDAANIAVNACLVDPDGGNPTESERLVCEEAYRRILAASKKGGAA